MEQMGIIRYVPPAETRGEAAPGPSNLWLPKYDLESLQSYPEVFQVGECVVVTEKLHGANARYVWQDGQFYCGSRTQWKLDTETDLWWRALRCHPGLMEYLQEFPGRVVYGEVFGNVQDLKYGLAGRGDHYHFAAFDILERDKWSSPWVVEALLHTWDVPTVPVVAGASILSTKVDPLKYESVDQMVELADGNSLWPGCEDQIREGIVISPLNVRHDPEIGYVKLKVVSLSYLERGAKRKKE
jgi:RNA ligase (TIGR02306 family)